jgi:signal transduction histidine kinase
MSVHRPVTAAGRGGSDRTSRREAIATRDPVTPRPVPVHDAGRRVRDVLPEVVRNVPVGIAVIRRDRTIAYRNDEATRLLRTDQGPVSGPSYLRPLRRPNGRMFATGEEPIDRLTATGEPVTRQTVVAERDDGSQITLSITATPLVEDAGPIVGAVLYAEDLTEDLDDVSLREAFVGVLSHELRTPITSIYGLTQLLLRDRMEPETRYSVIKDIASEAEQLHRLVEDLLAIARLERGVDSVGADPVLLQRLASQAASSEERRWPGRRVEVHADVGLPAIRGDDGYVMQILRNLVSNAVKYSPTTEPVVVTLAQEGNEIVTSVLDHGPGFPPETGDDAFRLFYRNPTIAARVPGTGIGLFVARALVEAQGGSIWLRNRPEGGAEVSFALPLFGMDELD